MVLRVKITTSPRRAPVNQASAARAASYALVQTAEVYPAPRCTLEYSGSTCVTRSETARRAGVVAA